jgi:UDP-N-acetylmuramoyl-tripeptide--D-alanyl-D-alanine ligase
VAEHPQQPWITSEIVEAVQGTLLSGNPARAFAEISTDSRTIHAGNCFLAIEGDVYDGHTFVQDVLNKDVKGLIINKDHKDSLEWDFIEAQGIVSIGVADTLTALGALAAYHRRRSTASVVAITGSNGKTSTRAMAAEALAKRFTILSPEGNFNNEVGLPLTLFRLNPSHEWAVLELGMNHPGEISRLGDICRPDIGLITNIGPAHLEGLGSLEGVMHAKGELLDKIKPNGKTILNADDPMTLHLTKKISKKPILFGLSDTADIRGVDISAHSDGISFTLDIRREQTRINLCVPGKFMVTNALAAASIAHVVGIPLPEIKSALENFSPIKGRMNLHRMNDGITLIDDTYNANPVSMKAAIRTLQELKKKNRGIVVLGDMLELGESSWSLHRETGLFAARAGISMLYATGEYADALAQGASEGGMAAKNIFSGAKADIFRNVMKVLASDDWVLVKGSRGMRMETLVKELMNELGKGQS